MSRLSHCEWNVFGSVVGCCAEEVSEVIQRALDRETCTLSGSEPSLMLFVSGSNPAIDNSASFLYVNYHRNQPEFPNLPNFES